MKPKELKKPLAYFGELNACHREIQKSGNELLNYAFRAGELLTLIKGCCEHGEYTPLVEKHFDGSERTSRKYAQVYKRLRELDKTARRAVLNESDGITEALAKLKPPEKTDSSPALTSSQQVVAAEKQPEPEVAPVDETYRPKRTDAVQDMENPCPLCFCDWWVPDEDGDYCDNCHHPWDDGEEDEGEVATDMVDSEQQNEGEEKSREPSKGKVKSSAANAVDLLTKQHIGHIARGLTNIAALNGGEGEQFRRADAGLNQIITALQKMRKGEQ